jgi:hypothetical protein
MASPDKGIFLFSTSSFNRSTHSPVLGWGS